MGREGGGYCILKMSQPLLRNIRSFFCLRQLLPELFGQEIACIQLQTRQSGTNYSGATIAFPGNGVHRIHKLK